MTQVHSDTTTRSDVSGEGALTEGVPGGPSEFDVYIDNVRISAQ